MVELRPGRAGADIDLRRHMEFLARVPGVAAITVTRHAGGWTASATPLRLTAVEQAAATQDAAKRAGGNPSQEALDAAFREALARPIVEARGASAGEAMGALQGKLMEWCVK